MPGPVPRVPPARLGDPAATGSGAPRASWAAAALLLVCCVAYWNSFSTGLVLDNIPIILQDPRLTAVAWRNVAGIFGFNYWWPTGESDLYRPLTTLSYWFNYAVLGGAGNPFGYHALNLLLHWLNAVLAFLLVRGVTGRFWVALVTAGLFACHPLTVESVTNVVGRADLLAGLSILGGVCLYRGFRDASGGRRWRWIAALGVAYAAGVFCKESAVVLPALLLLHDWLFPPDRGATRRATLGLSAARVWPAYASLLPGAVLLVAARWIMFHQSPLFGQFGGDNPITLAPVWTGVMTSVKVAGYYLGLIAWPARLSCDYSYSAITLFSWTLASGQDGHAWLALATLLVLAAAMVLTWRRLPPVAFFLGFAGVAFLPTANLLFPIGTVMAERLMYVPLVGVIAAAVTAAAHAGERRLAGHPAGARRMWAVMAALAVAAAISALSARTVVRNRDWDSNLSIWASAAAVVPDSYKVYKALALTTMESDPSGARVDEAIALAARSMSIIESANLPLHHQPAGLYAEAGSYHLRRAQVLSDRGENGNAQAAVAQAITLLARAESIDRELNRLARETLLRLGKRPEDIHDIGSAFIYRTLATAYVGAGDPLRAVAAAQYVQRLSPQYADAHYMRGVSEAAAAQFEQAKGRQHEADDHLASAAVNLLAATIVDPAHHQSWSLLAKVYGFLSPSPQAVFLAAGGGRLNGENPLVVTHVQAACAQLLAQLRGAGLTAEADALRGRMVTELGVPAAALDTRPADRAR